MLAESYERIHRSNLVGMGILPLQFAPGENVESLGLTGFEVFDIPGIANGLKPGQKLKVQARDESGKTRTIDAICRIDTPYEMQYYQHGGILQFVLRQLLG